MRKDFFEFVPKGPPIFVTNKLPGLRRADPAIQRRMRIVPFTKTVERVDKALPQYIRERLMPAIVGWLIEGAAEYLAHGLPATPQAVKTATQGYIDVQAWLSGFLDAATEPDTYGAITPQRSARGRVRICRKPQSPGAIGGARRERRPGSAPRP